MRSLLVTVKSHLFPQFVHLNQERGKVAASLALGREARLQLSITVGVDGHGTRERGRAAAVKHGWAGNPSDARRRQLLTTLTHNRFLVEAPG